MITGKLWGVAGQEVERVGAKIMRLRGWEPR